MKMLWELCEQEEREKDRAAREREREKKSAAAERGSERGRDAEAR
jgi:hypothetical protein